MRPLFLVTAVQEWLKSTFLWTTVYNHLRYVVRCRMSTELKEVVGSVIRIY